ncbi:hypothetical protein EDB89DRAFT_2065859 [Lactarius sanguifluus]|nr:hypothetical protein EDB89DRAFT_2065859 [Lactarius sanguifluus]
MSASDGFPSGAVSIASTPTGSPNTGDLEEGGVVKSESESKQATTIDVLPDNVLQIFDFCRINHDPDAYPPRPVWDWHQLVHVCQRWRQIVFASPRRLDLQIYCTYGTPVRENLCCWPALPIAIDYYIYYGDDGREDLAPPYNDCDEAIAALGHPDRVRSIQMSATGYLWNDMAEVLQRPFPVLTHLALQSTSIKRIPSLPDSFLGGYTPRLQKFALADIPFPTFPIFLRSARDLVKFRLIDIPYVNEGPISAEMMAANMAGLTKLEYLNISFKNPWMTTWSFSPMFTPDQIPAVPLTRIVLPALTRFRFYGTRQYLEEFVAQIETPQLADLTVTFISGTVQTLQLSQFIDFIGRAEYLKLAEFRRARVHFDEPGAHISLSRSQTERRPCYFDLGINCGSHIDRIPFMIQLLTQLKSTLIISNVRHLSIAAFDERPLSMRGNLDPAEWLAFFHPFVAVETLRVCDRLAGLVVTLLEDSTEDMVAEVLPALQMLNLEGQPLTSGALHKFVAGRRLSGRLVAVDNSWENLPCDMCHQP